MKLGCTKCRLATMIEHTELLMEIYLENAVLRSEDLIVFLLRKRKYEQKYKESCRLEAAFSRLF